MIQFILMDIEGTTTSIDFVHQTLFPYAAERLPEFIRTNQEDGEVKFCLDDVADTVEEEEGSRPDLEGCISALEKWMREDRKHTSLKQLQGLIWRNGYEQGHFTGHIYPDVPPAMRHWNEHGFEMGIYSSGSVEAQQLLFGYSSEGDLLDYLIDFFDTNFGHKREPASYQNISNALGLPAESVLFLSDVEAELDAAREAGMKTMQLVREGTEPSDKHPTASTFTEILV